MQANGSIQQIPEIPQDIKDLYKTVWEISQKAVIDMAADRGAYICQSQSMNIHLQDANFGKMTSMHFYSWKKGLKTGMYYLRTKAAADAIKFTVQKSQTAQPAAQPNAVPVGDVSGSGRQQQAIMRESEIKQANSQAAIQCSLDDPDGCEMCGS